MSESLWYIGGKDRKPYGPYSLDRLREAVKSGKVLPETYLLAEGASQWVRAASVPELFSGPRTVPPPPTVPESTPAEKPSKTSTGGRWAYVAAAVVFLICSMYQCSGVGERAIDGGPAKLIRVWDPFVAGLLLLNSAILIMILGNLERPRR